MSVPEQGFLERVDMFASSQIDEINLAFQRQWTINHFLLSLLEESGVMDDITPERVNQLYAKAASQVEQEAAEQRDKLNAELSPSQRRLIELLKGEQP